MYGILGNAPSAKFIFFAMDDLNRDPDPKEVKRLLVCKTANVYKANGRYRQNFSDINRLLSMRAKGANLRDPFHKTNEEYISHAVRVDDDCKFSSFLEIRYSGLIHSWPFGALLTCGTARSATASLTAACKWSSRQALASPRGRAPRRRSWSGGVMRRAGATSAAPPSA